MSNRRRLTPAPRQTFVSRPPAATPTYWNGEPADCARVYVRVADSGRFPDYWARQYVGQVRAAVRVRYGGWTSYLDNEDGDGWRKVTEGRGSPRWPHRNLEISAELPGR